MKNKLKIMALTMLVPAFNAYASDDKDFPEDLVLKSIISDQNIYKNKTPNKAKVTEFFYYGCIHCYRMEYKLKNWIKNKPKNIVFERVPAVFPGWERGARLFYTAKKLNVEEKFTTDFFNTTMRKKMPLNEASALTVFKKYGISEREFYKVYNSFIIKNKVKRAKKMADTLEIDSVPTFVVNYKYITNESLAGSKDEMFKVIEKLANYVVDKK